MMGTKAERAQELIAGLMGLYMDMDEDLEELKRLGYGMDSGETITWDSIWNTLQGIEDEVVEALAAEEDERREAEDAEENGGEHEEP